MGFAPLHAPHKANSSPSTGEGKGEGETPPEPRKPRRVLIAPTLQELDYLLHVRLLGNRVCLGEDHLPLFVDQYVGPLGGAFLLPENAYDFATSP